MRVVTYRGKWYAYYREAGTTRRIALRAESREAAERALVDLQRGGAPTTVGDMVEQYLAEKGFGAKHNRRYAWRAAAPVFAVLRPDQVDRGVCRTYIERRRAAGVRDATIIHELGVVRAALRKADRNTPAVFETPPEPAPKELYLTREQYRALREAARPSAHLYLFVVLAYTTAARARAVLELTWDRVDYEHERIMLGHTSGRMKGRASPPMTDGARAALLEAQKAAQTDYVIEWGGRPVRSVKRAFAAAAERAGVPWCTPHVLRHSAAVHMVEGGIALAEVGQYLGHTDLRVTYRVYARFSPSHLRQAASVLE